MDGPGSEAVAPDLLDVAALLDEVLSKPWHLQILRMLGDRPSRYVNIVSALLDAPEPPKSENQVNVTLREMRKLGLVEKADAAKQAPWALTPTGVRVLAQKDGVDRHLWAVRSEHDDSAELAKLSPSDRETIRPDVPHPARRYNYWLGGKDNFAADRASGDELERLFPGARIGALANREFLVRAVRYLVAECGIRQFLDIGTGLPSAGNTHEVAQSIAPESRVVYVDNDPLVLTHAKALLTSSPAGRTAYIQADVRQPSTILNSPVLRENLDLSQPVALMMVAVLHFIPGEGAARPLVEELLDALAPGSFLIVTHLTHDFTPAEIVEAHRTLQRQGRSDFWMRSKTEFTELFSGLKLVDPGVVTTTEWRPDSVISDVDLRAVTVWAAVGRKTVRKAEQTLITLVSRSPLEHTLRALADGPTRYTDIRARIVKQGGRAPLAGQLNKVLGELTALGLIGKESSGDGQSASTRAPWTLTEQGRSALQDLELYRRLSRTEIVPLGDDEPTPDVELSQHQVTRVAQSPGTATAASRNLEEQVAKFNLAETQPARRYNALLGGKDNFAVDRAAAAKILERHPAAGVSAVENRLFMQRAVRFLGSRGIRQFLDIGTGIPVSPNTHEIAQEIDPTARVVYVDNDPFVGVHARALLTSSPEGRTVYLDADLREPRAILDASELRSVLDFSQPVGLLLVAVLHFIRDDDDPREILGMLVGALPPGSFVVASHATPEYMPPEQVVALRSVMERQWRDRTGTELKALFDLPDLELMEPGVQSVAHWWGDEAPKPRPPVEDVVSNGIVAVVRR
ncbi:SAM-dependent methyltransferase [Paractinoplanes toevensis]|uniref:S-adenosyl methyltransferase n=1 Tax=Paractinoplanes toevensis TaxID=571911 RepID=A0A919W255_9ACTN|nr:SAM-dependent methyltransferase [Actinoplanes toevensis]GIM93197.1 hypothetical protein Ato02nite_049900 [Actinoplanes toevensis]